MKQSKVKKIIEKTQTIKNKIAELPFEEAIKTYIEILNETSTKTKKYLITHAFLKYINENFNRFKELIENNEEIKTDFQELIRINSEIEGDNLVRVIIDDEKNAKLIDFLNEKIDFKKYYLKDNIMSIINTADESIYKNLNKKHKKYIYSSLYNLFFDEEKQLEIYEDNLKEYPDVFVKNLFYYSEIIYENTPNDLERSLDINKAMFNFTNIVINNKDCLSYYLYNISKIFNNNPSEIDYYNTFLISMTYKDIFNFLLNEMVKSKDICDKLKILISLPPLKEIKTIEDLKHISIPELYELEVDTSFSVSNKIDSVNARNNYEFEIFDNNRQVIKISKEETKVVHLTDDELKIDDDYSHMDGLVKLYPEFSKKEVPGEIIVPANSIYHDIIIITEGDSMKMFLPNVDNMDMNQIEGLKSKLDEISDLSKISVMIAMECDGNYLEIPFSTPDILIEYLKSNKKVK